MTVNLGIRFKRPLQMGERGFVGADRAWLRGRSGGYYVGVQVSADANLRMMRCQGCKALAISRRTDRKRPVVGARVKAWFR